MINLQKISEILNSYDLDKLTIGVLGGHSALDVCAGAKKYGFRTLAVCKKGREKTYSRYYKTQENDKGCVDEVILVNEFADIVNSEIQQELRKRNTIFIHNRYFWVYFNDFAEIEEKFEVPIFGLRQGVKLEERDQELNQYNLLQKAGIRMPKIVRKGNSGMNESETKKVLEQHFEESQAPLIVKVNEAIRTYERAFYIIIKPEDYLIKAEAMIEKGIINKADLANATIEEFVIGAQVNLNFFYSILDDELELMGTDSRRQTSLDGFLRLDAVTQSILLKQGYKPSMIETGHYAVTMKESLVEKAYEIGEKFVKIMKTEVEPGMIGPFALQGAVATEKGKEEFVIFDVSMRIPGSPGTKFTPYSGYLYGQSISYGERIAMEIKNAVKMKMLEKLLT